MQTLESSSNCSFQLLFKIVFVASISLILMVIYNFDGQSHKMKTMIRTKKTHAKQEHAKHQDGSFRIRKGIIEFDYYITKLIL